MAEPYFTRLRRISLKKAHLLCRCAFFWRRHPESHRTTDTVSFANRILPPAAAEPADAMITAKREGYTLGVLLFLEVAAKTLPIFAL